MSISSLEEDHSTHDPEEPENDNDDEQIQRLNDNHNGIKNGEAVSLSMEATRAIAVQALSLTVQDWPEMGRGDDPSVSEAMLWNTNNGMEIGIERVTVLLLVRMVALQLIGSTNDLSTSGICRQALLADQLPWPFITQPIVDQLRQLVHYLLNQYSLILPYHNPVHAVSVVVSCNKLIDLLLAPALHGVNEGGRPWTFGLRRDPLPLAALLFAALCHDAGHVGVTNRQLVLENDERALIYNDQSVQEKHSLTLLFGELLKPEYALLRSALFGDVAAADGHYQENYRYFRSTVIMAVMSTDIASPEQMETTKSKWKEAFGQEWPKGGKQLNQALDDVMPLRLPLKANRRGSNYSEISEITNPDMNFPTSPRKMRGSHNGGGDRTSHDAVDDDYLSNDDGGMLQMFHQSRNQLPTISFDPQRRRLSNQSMGDESDFAADSVVLLKSRNLAHPLSISVQSEENDANASLHTPPRRHSNDSQSANSQPNQDQAPRQVTRTRSSNNAAHQGKLLSYPTSRKGPSQQHPDHRGVRSGRGISRRASTESHSTFDSFAQDSLNGVGGVQRIAKRSENGGSASLRRMSSVKRTSYRQSFLGPGRIGFTHDADDGDGHDSVEHEHRRSRSLDSTDFAVARKSESAWNDNVVVLSRGMDRIPSTYTNTSYGYGSLAGESIGVNRRRMDTGKKNELNNNDTKWNTEFLVLHGAGKDSADYPHSPLPVGSPRRNTAEIANFDGELDDQDSFSLTPPSSEDEYVSTRQREITALSSMLQLQNTAAGLTKSIIAPKGSNGLVDGGAGTCQPRRGSTGMVPSRFASLAGLRIDEDVPHITTAASADMDFDHRDIDWDLVRSNPTSDSSKYRKRLGIRRSMDLSGEVLEIFQGRSSLGYSTHSALSRHSSDVDDPVDYLRATAILETMLRAADVGHYLQSWSSMTRWSGRMYLELARAHQQGRGSDPFPSWYKNQIRILDSYLRPLAQQLDESRVFGEDTGAMFVLAVNDIKEHWLKYGLELTKRWAQEASAATTATML